MRIDLTDQVALVTGSAHRVGKSIALELARQGVHILVHYNGSDEGTVRDTLHEIKSLGVDAFDVQADIAQPDGVALVMQSLQEHFGRLNILVNSASVFQRRDLLDVTLDDWELTMNVNLRAPFLLTQQAALLMRENDPPGGAIVNISDRGALIPSTDYSHHSISKAALLSLSQLSALSLGPDIRVNTVIPGPVMKPPRMDDAQWAWFGQQTPLKTTGDGDDVARAVAYLVGESYITGTVINVGGGDHLSP